LAPADRAGAGVSAGERGPGDTVTVRFPGTPHAPVVVPAGCELAVHLDVQNAPVLFGCRTGLCGTCAAVVEGALPPPSAEEQEVLDIEWEGVSGARLLCQLRPRADVTVRRVLGVGG
jgi:ferredoxin